MFLENSGVIFEPVHYIFLQHYYFVESCSEAASGMVKSRSRMEVEFLSLQGELGPADCESVSRLLKHFVLHMTQYQ